MRKRRRWLSVTALTLVVVAGVIIFAGLLSPFGLLGQFYWQGPIHEKRLASHWREILCQDGRNGQLEESRRILYSVDRPQALKILRACAVDPDRNIRWPAIALIGKADARSVDVLALLINALTDRDTEVRIQAVSVLANWGSMARPAIPALSARLNDSAAEVAHYAEFALWQIDNSQAPAICGWKTYAFPEFGFSIMLPEEPRRKIVGSNEIVSTGYFLQAGHRAGTSVGASQQYTISVLDLDESVDEETAGLELHQRQLETAPSFFGGGKIRDERKISLEGRSGREFFLDTESKGTIRSRHYWGDHRFWALHVVYDPEFFNPHAAVFFLDSFHLEKKTKMPLEKNK